ncbi:MAG: hypothetical protein KF857_11720 [Fimbriimonadaceae bacterium]|nr:hypothetical protein [Fimbriimonadaceae bacterium]
MRTIIRTLLVVASLSTVVLVGCSSEPAADTSSVVPKEKAPAGLQDSEGAGKPAKTAPDQTATAP